MESKTDYKRRIFYILMFFALILAAFILKAAKAVFLPVTVCILLSCVFFPVINQLHKRLRIPYIVGIFTMSLLFVFVILIFSTIIATSLNMFLSRFPEYEEKFSSIYRVLAQTLNFQFYEDKTLLENLWSQLKVREIAKFLAIAFSTNLITIVRSLFLVLLLTIFFLIELNGTKEKTAFMFNTKFHTRFAKIVRKMIAETMHFISIKFFISLLTGFLVYLSCIAVRLNFAIMWGFLAFIMNFIPTFGSIFSVAINTIFSVLQFYPNPLPMGFIFLSLTMINMILGNIVEPKITGDHLGLSPFIILVSLLFWGWMWGFVGLLLAVPLTVIMKIIAENVSFLHWAAILMGNKVSDTQKELSSETE